MPESEVNFESIDLSGLLQPRKINEEYSIWMCKQGIYTPAINLRLSSELPAGAYKIKYSNQEYQLTPIPINTDELYVFSEDCTQTILHEACIFWDKAELYKENKLVHKRGILLEGIPGCGKSAIISLVVKELINEGGLVFLINSYEELALMVEAMKPIIRKLEPNRQIITIIEDIDKIIDEDGDADILEYLDGKASINNHLVILTSNNTTNLSEALLRPSRIDMRFVISPPKARIRKEFFTRKGVPEERIAEFVEKTQNMSFADLKEVFISVIILGKDLDLAIKTIKNPLASKNYLDNKKKITI